MTLRYWTNQTVNMQSAIGATQTITGISKANPGVVTTSGTLPSNGDRVLILCSGMQQLNYRVFKVAGASGSTFNIGEDTSGYSTFSAGTFQVITLGNSFTSLREPNASGGDPVFEDTTTIHDAQETQAIISSSPQSYSFTADFEPTDTALKAANSAFKLRSPRVFQILDSDSSEFIFYGYVVCTFAPGVSGKKKTVHLSISLLGAGTAF
jgi:hypothetical protein